MDTHGSTVIEQLDFMNHLFQQGQQLLKEAIENLKIATRRYAKKQHKWVQNRLIRRADRQVPPVYSLDCTDVEQWESKVYGKAVEIVSAVMRGEMPQEPATNSVILDAKITDSSNETSNFCQVCDRLFIGDLQWTEHLKGAKHRKVVQKKKRLESYKVKNSNTVESDVAVEYKDNLVV